MLPSSKRLNTKNVNDVIKDSQAKNFSSAIFSLRVKKNPKEQEQSRISVVISKKVEKKAVDRNKTRRRISGVLENFTAIKKGFINLIFVRKKALDLTPKDLRFEIEGLLRKAGLI